LTNDSAIALQSNNYIIDEPTLGSGGLDQSSSSNYKISNATNDLSIGNATSSNYQIEAGSTTTSDPALSFSISNANANFSDFSPTIASTATANFSVSNYTSYGYVVQIFGQPPTNGSHIITPLSTSDTSKIGIEQFGINLVANTLPISFGSNPNNGQFGFGSISSNYSTANNFRYNNGDTIAYAAKSSGVTIYTISYLVNVASITPGGKYSSNQTIVVTGTY
jgi:hypothetical protein